MTIRSQFQPVVDEFIADLNTFATGSYLREDEKEFWEEPFNPEVLPELKQLVEMFLDALDLLGDDPEAESLLVVVEGFHANLHDFNRKHHDAVLEPEEKQDLQELISDASAATGADDEALNQLPELE